MSNKVVNMKLMMLRVDLRNGKVRVMDGDLKSVVMERLGPVKLHPATEARFTKLFNVPWWTDGQGKTRHPSQDDYARAIQNFINRRFEPWAWFADTVTVDNSGVSLTA